MKHYVCGFCFGRYTSGEPCVALILKTHPDWQRGLLNGVGGLVGPGETVHEAMVREFREETGLETPPFAWTERVEMAGPDRIVHFMAAHVSEIGLRDPNKLPRLVAAKTDGEPEVPNWWPAVPVPDGVVRNLRWVIPLCSDPDVIGSVDVCVKPH